MSKSNIKILLVLATIAVLGLTYMYVFKPNMDDKKALESEIETLEAKRADLQAQNAHKDEYLAEIEVNKAYFDEVVDYFPATLDQEISVMFIKGVEKDKGNLQFDVNSVGLGQPELFYTLGGTTTETEEGTASGYECYAASFPINYEGSYEGLKDFIDYIMAYKYRMNISSFSITYNAQEDTYSGNVQLNAYCVAGADRVADTVSVNVDNGVYNPFLGGEGAVAPTSSSHDSDNGDSIVADHDILIALNNANNDSTDGIILSAGGSDTYVTSSDNSVVDVTITVAEEDGKNMVTYAIGSDSYTTELADDELTVYVESSDRVDSNDTNGVKVKVENSTDVPVYVKVEGDDTTAPRFELGSKTGVVKVY
ncbi:MAG: hypothetical protein J6A59_00710 [Lachnospiraceae bacterium]|nr:hypothetical protein [Lachnospiraceae bacterium]